MTTEISDLEATQVRCHICGRGPRRGLQWWRRHDWSSSWSADSSQDLCARCGALPVAAAFKLLARRLQTEKSA